MVDMKRDLSSLRPRPRAKRGGGGGSTKGGVRLHQALPVERGGGGPPRSGENTDQKLAVSAVQAALKKSLGFWAEAGLILHGYEFRSLVRLASGEKGFSYLVHDLRNFGKPIERPHPPEGYRVLG
jgi:hypothetical protein